MAKPDYESAAAYLEAIAAELERREIDAGHPGSVRIQGGEQPIAGQAKIRRAPGGTIVGGEIWLVDKTTTTVVTFGDGPVLSRTKVRAPAKSTLVSPGNRVVDPKSREILEDSTFRGIDPLTGRAGQVLLGRPAPKLARRG